MKKCLMTMVVLMAFSILSKSAFAADEAPWYHEFFSNLGVELIENEKITRGEFMEMALQFLGPSAMIFESVSVFGSEKEEGFPLNILADARTVGLCRGYPDGTVRPYDNIKFDEAVMMCLGAMELRENYTSHGHTYPIDYIQIADNLGLLDDMEYVAGDEILTADAEKLLVRAMTMATLRVTWVENYYYEVVSYGPLYDYRAVYQRYDTLNNIIDGHDMEVICTVPDASMKYNYYIDARTDKILGCEPMSEEEAFKREEYRKKALYFLRKWHPGVYYNLVVYNYIYNIEDEYGYDADGNWNLLCPGVVRKWSKESSTN